MDLQYTDKDINTLKDLEPVRHHSGMYLGMSPEDPKANWQLVKEILDNSIDETIATGRHIHIDIKFLYNKIGKWQCVIRDNGRGVPLGKLVDSFSKLHTSGKHSGAYAASVGTHGIGAKLTAALSNTFIALSKRDGQIGMVQLQKGKIVRNKFTKCPKSLMGDTGTVVFFEPDDTIVTTVDTFIGSATFNGVLDLIEFFDVYIDNVSFTVTMDNLIPSTILDMNSTEMWNTLSGIGSKLIYTPQGLSKLDYVHKKFKIKKAHAWELLGISKKMSLVKEEDRLGYDIDLFLPKHFPRGPQLVAAVNMVPIGDLNSSHLSPLIHAIKQCVSANITDKDLANYFMKVYKLPICGSVMVRMKDASFIGQNKTGFQRKEFATPYHTSLIKKFRKQPPELWQKLTKLLYSDIEEQYAKYTNRTMLSKGLKNINLDLNNIKCYYGCSSTNRDEVELLITEGNSAGGSVVKKRDSKTQAVFKLKGKPINLMKNEDYNNSIMQDLIRIIGISPADTNLDNMNFKNIGILTDADSDGYHIAALLVGNLYKINPRIVDEGRVFIANPPLYALSVKNQEKMFIRDQTALVDMYVSKLYSPLLQLEILNGKQITLLKEDSFREFCHYIDRIGSIFQQVSDSLAIEPLVLEWMTRCVKYLNPINTNKIKKVLHQDNVSYDKNKNCLILTQGIIDIFIPLERLEMEIRNTLLPELNRISEDWDKITVLFSSKHTSVVRYPISFIQLYNEFVELNKLISVHRLKGLGEMTPAALEFTTINPKTRSQTKITTLGRVETLFEMLGVDTQYRKKLMSQ